MRREWTERDKQMHSLLREELKRQKQKREQNAPKFTTSIERANTRTDWGCTEGKKRYDGFWNAISQIEATYLRLSVQQRHIVEEFVRSCIVKITGESFQANPPYFMDLCGKKTQECLSIVITPRRFGKTTACAIFVAALLISIPGLTVAIFSTGRRASTMLLAKINQIIQASSPWATSLNL